MFHSEILFAIQFKSFVRIFNTFVSVYKWLISSFATVVINRTIYRPSYSGYVYDRYISA